MTARLVVIGNGMAGMRCVEEIIRMAPERYEITVFGAEKRPNYNRILLSEVLHGERAFDDIVLHSLSWYEQHDIQLYMGEMVTLIDSARRTVRTASGLEVGYDVLIVATGSVPYIPPLPGSDKKGVIAFRTLDDCEQMTAYAERYRKAVVLGGGLLGLEAARGLLQLGMETHVVHNAPYLMNRQLDEMSATLLRRELEEQGMRFALNRQTVRVTGAHRAQGLRFANGERLAADLIVMAVGIRPNIRLAQHSGLATNRAIIVDDWMRTSVPDVYAVGECAEHRGISYGLVAPLYEQAKILAAHLCEQPATAYAGSLPYSQLKISGVQVFSIGDIQSPHSETLVQQYDGVARTYRKITATHGRINGAVLYGNTAEGTALVDMIKQGRSTAEWLEREQAFSPVGQTHDPAEAAAIALAPTSIICACNAVSKQQILDVIRQHDLQTADEVKEYTRASGSCGGCRPTVEALTRCSVACEQEAFSGRSTEAQTKPAAVTVCDCLPYTHAELREQVLTLTDTPHWKQIFAEANGSSSSGHDTKFSTSYRLLESSPSSDKQPAFNPTGMFTGKPNDQQVYARIPLSAIQMLHSTLTAASDPTTTSDCASDPTGCELCLSAIHHYAHVASMLYTDASPLTNTATSIIENTPLTSSHRYLNTPTVNVTAEWLASMNTDWQQHLLPHPLHIVTEATGITAEATIRLADLGILPSPDGWELYAGGYVQPLQTGQLIGEMEHWSDVLSLLDACLHYYVSTAYYGEAMYEWLERIGLLHVREHVLHSLYEPAAGTSVMKGVDPDANSMSILQRTM
ncbi:FAD-dependent oxidoreductase [Paenibacillus wenxiniae]|uniref:FAD-dependent oxidoreductase n=1 Tax=Paenibacillus wenxiniae TaxID=1636843 RepID=A0ABW4RHU9_9BACL